ARSSWSSDQYESARLVAKLTDDRRQTKLVKILDLERNDAEHGRRRTTLIEYVRAETGQSLQAEREVELEAFFKAVLLRVGHDAVGQLLGFSRRHLRQVERHQVPVDTNLRRRIGGNV